MSVEDRRANDVLIQARLAEHDKDIDVFNHALESLVATGMHTNKKLDHLVDAMGLQNVLIEKVNNMDKNLVDSFARRDDRLLALEKTQSGNGCPKLMVSQENIATLVIAVADVKDHSEVTRKEAAIRMESIETKIGSFVSGTIVRWVIGLLITATLAVYTISASTDHDTREMISVNAKEVVRLDKLAVEKISMQRQTNIFSEARLKRVEDDLRLHLTAQDNGDG